MKCLEHVKCIDDERLKHGMLSNLNVSFCLCDVMLISHDVCVTNTRHIYMTNIHGVKH